jgi:hypothetical protein
MIFLSPKGWKQIHNGSAKITVIGGIGTVRCANTSRESGMTIEQRVAKLERSANCYRSGCILLAMALIVALHVGAEPTTKPDAPFITTTKILDADIVLCKQLSITDDKGNRAFHLSSNNIGTSLTLGENTDFPIDLMSTNKVGAISIGKKGKPFGFSAEVSDDRSDLAQTALGETLALVTTDKTGGSFIASNLSGQFFGMTFAGTAKGIKPATQPAKE